MSELRIDFSGLFALLSLSHAEDDQTWVDLTVQAV